MTADEKEKTLTGLKNAYEAMSIYKKILTSGEKEDDFIHTAFGQNEHALADIAKIFGFKSELLNTIEKRNERAKVRNERIRVLEEEIAKKTTLEQLRENIKKIKKHLNVLWNEEGFHGSYNINLRETGKVNVLFQLSRLNYAWDLEIEEEEEELEAKYKEAFESKQFEVIGEGENTYILANDTNEKKLTETLQKLFPCIEIWEFKRRRWEEGVFVLTEIDTIIPDLLFMEAIK